MLRCTEKVSHPSAIFARGGHLEVSAVIVKNLKMFPIVHRFVHAENEANGFQLSGRLSQDMYAGFTYFRDVYDVPEQRKI